MASIDGNDFLNMPQDSLNNADLHLSIKKQLEASPFFADGGTAACTPEIFSFAIKKDEIMNPDQEAEMIPEDPAQPIMQYGDESDIKLQANFALEQILEMHKDSAQRPQVEAICIRLLQQIKFNLVRKLI